MSAPHLALVPRNGPSLRLKHGKGHHGRAARLHRGKRYLLVTASGFAVPVRYLGRIRDRHGVLLMVRATR